MIRFTPISFVYSVLLVGGLIQASYWIAPVRNLSNGGCKIDYVYDGDTVALDCGQDVETARLVGFDTAEVRDAGCPAESAHGNAATERLRVLVSQGTVTMSGDAHDKYGRLLVSLYVVDVDVGDTLIAEGLAVSYRGGQRINWCARLGAA